MLYDGDLTDSANLLRIIEQVQHVAARRLRRVCGLVSRVASGGEMTLTSSPTPSDAAAPLRLPPDLHLRPEPLALVSAENREALGELAAMAV